MAKDYANSEVVGYNPTPGPKNPGKYPFVGPSYQYYGEQQGYIYDPYSDNYVPDPKVQNQYYEDAGIKEEDPSYMDALIPVAATGVTYGLAQGFANNPDGFMTGIGNMIPSWGSSAPAATNAAPAAANTAPVATNATTTVASNTGLMPSGSDVASTSANLGSGAAQSGTGSTSEIIGQNMDGSYIQSGAGAAQAGAGSAGEIIGQNMDGSYIYGTDAAANAGSSWMSTASEYASYAAMAYAAYNAATSFDDWQKKGDDYAATRAEQQAALIAANYFTGGLAGLAEGGMRAAAPHFMNEVDEFATKYGLLGNIVRAFGSSKDETQRAREAMWGGLKKTGVVAKDNTWTKADGTTWDFGIDGDHKLDNKGANIDGKDKRHYYDVDFSDPNIGITVADLDPIGAIMAGGNEKGTKDATGKWVNAVTSSGDPKANTLKVYTDLGFDRNTAWQTIDEMVKAKKLDQAKGDAYKNSIDRVFGAGEYAKGGSQYGVAPVAPPLSATQPGAQPSPTPPGNQAPSLAGAPLPPKDTGYGNGTAVGSHGVPGHGGMSPQGEQMPAGYGGMDPRHTAMQPRGPQSTGLIPSQTPPPSNVNQVLRPRNNSTALGAPRTGSSANQFMTTPGSGNSGLMPRDNNVMPQAQQPRPGFGIRVSPGVYKDPKTGKTYLSKDGAL